MALIGCERSGRTRPLLKYIKKMALLHKNMLYFFIVAPGHQSQVKKKEKILKKTKENGLLDG